MLVVDDDEDICEIVQMVLEHQGYEVTTANSGLRAWELVERGADIALILLDLMMPDMDGETFVHKLRAQPTSAIPVVIMSGHDSGEAKAHELRAEGFLKKPVGMAVLVDEVRKHALP